MKNQGKKWSWCAIAYHFFEAAPDPDLDLILDDFLTKWSGSDRRSQKSVRSLLCLFTILEWRWWTFYDIRTLHVQPNRKLKINYLFYVQNPHTVSIIRQNIYRLRMCSKGFVSKFLFLRCSLLVHNWIIPIMKNHRNLQTNRSSEAKCLLDKIALII